jgi:predicted nucleic acid-binding protein
MPQAWDTTTAARLRPNSSVLAYAANRQQAGDPIAFTASTLNEISYGLCKAAAAGNPAADVQLRWLRDEIGAGIVDILAFDERAADVAGALRARMPIPPPRPTGKRQHQRRSKADSRVAWIMDLQTAATAFVHGYDLVTADAHHSVIVEQLNALAPTAPAPMIQTPPAF